MAKKALMLSVVAFAIFFLLARPAGAADAVEGLADVAGEAFRQVARFFTALID
jgi:hypothetical protein